MLFIRKLLQYIIQFAHLNHILRRIQLIISLQTSHLQKYQPKRERVLLKRIDFLNNPLPMVLELHLRVEYGHLVSGI